MITPFSLLLQLSCMSQAEAAQYLEVRLDTVQKWVSGRDPCPPGVIVTMRHIINCQTFEAFDTLKVEVKFEGYFGGNELEKIVLTEPSPAELGPEKLFPTLGAWRGYAARVIADAPHGAEIVIKPASEK